MDSRNNQPHIIKFRDADPELRPQYFIAIEQKLVIECNSLVGAMFTLLATHYVFDLGYHTKAKDFFKFLEHLLDIDDKTTKEECQLSFSPDGHRVF